MSYDTWLEAPYQRSVPSGVEDLGNDILFPAHDADFCRGSRIIYNGKKGTILREGPHEDYTIRLDNEPGYLTLVGEAGRDQMHELSRLDTYDEWEDEDEDGKYGGVTLTLINAHGHTATVELSDAVSV